MRYLLVATVVLLAGCGHITEVVVSDYRPFEPLPIYETWYNEVRECSGHYAGSMFSIRWFTAEVVHYQTEEWTARDGVWIKPRDIILHVHAVEVERVVKHELLHFLLQDSGHPEEFDVCGV